MNSAGSLSMGKPIASLIWVEKMTNAIPLVKPTINGCGKNFRIEPSLSNPKDISIIPAMMVEIISPSNPYF